MSATFRHPDRRVLAYYCERRQTSGSFNPEAASGDSGSAGGSIPAEPAREASRLDRAFVRFAAFSLLEVVAAVAIFAVGMTGVLGLFVPIVRSIAASSDAEAAAGVAETVRARLLTMPFETAAALLQEESEMRQREKEGEVRPHRTTGGPPPAVLFGLKGGGLAVYDPAGSPPGWYDGGFPPLLRSLREARFEIDLIRHPWLSPRSGDATAAVIAFNIRVRWPVLESATGGIARVGVVESGGGAPLPYDERRKKVLFLSGTLTR